ncbi:hypothetical protein GGI07_005536 [Coemansia sp. Benny D115]|nr:hypothetical protein GGI07_005536 [Coemansia sp. Benny D115]
MWSQAIFLVAAFGVGFYLATLTARTSSAPKADRSDAKPESAAAEPQSLAAHGSSVANSTHGGASSRKKKKARKGKAAADAADAAPPFVTTASAKPAELASDDVAAPETKKRTATPPAPAPAPAPALSDEQELLAERETAAEDEWEMVGRHQGAPAVRKRATPIPTHPSAWQQLASDEDLDARDSDQAATPARVLRIGAASKPPPQPVRVRRQYVEPPPPTRKQRQNQKKADRVREAKAEASALQEQRLQQHQRDLFDVRSREQWKKAQLNPPKTPWIPSASASSSKTPKTKTAAAADLEGKLIWD